MMSETWPTQDDYEDRLTDQALAEVLGSKRPPDLSDDILAALRPRWYKRRAPRLAMAASILIAAGAGAMLYINHERNLSERQLLIAANDRLRSIDRKQLDDQVSDNRFGGSRTMTIDEAPFGVGQVVSVLPATSSPAGGIQDDMGVNAGLQPFGTDVSQTTAGKSLRFAPTGARLTQSGDVGMRLWDADANGVENFGASPATSQTLDSYVDGGVTHQWWNRPEVQPGLDERDEVHPLSVQDGQTPWGEGAGQAGDRHSRIEENPFLAVTQNPLSTFSIDVDTASYAKTRRYLLEANLLPPPDAVRIEELVNYFSYAYPGPEGDKPFAAHVEVAACPWQSKHRLVRVGLKGKEIKAEDRPASNLVFLLDVSGSMEPEDRLPRVRRAMRMLVEQLGENDRVAIVVYAGASGLVLPSTPGYQKEKILSALENLQAGGSTNGAAGIHLAYDTAAAHMIKGGTNRVVLCTDGDFNVGVTSTADLERLAEEKAKSGVFLTVLGVGMGNHNDDLLEKLADKGNGNYGYIDSEQEAKKLLVDELGGTLVTIAKDVKIQIEFNPRQVGSYRLIGYENRLLRAEDFNDDQKDAGEIGAGHTITALYELVPAGDETKASPVDPLKYQQQNAAAEAAGSGELLTLKLRYKDPDGQESHEPLVFPIKDSGHPFGQASGDFKFASAVASFGMLLRNSEHKGETSYDAVQEIAAASLGEDQHGYRAGFLELVRKAKQLNGK